MNNYAEALGLLEGQFDEFPDKTLTLGPNRVKGKLFWSVWNVDEPDEALAQHENPLQAVELAFEKLWQEYPIGTRNL